METTKQGMRSLLTQVTGDRLLRCTADPSPRYPKTPKTPLFRGEWLVNRGLLFRKCGTGSYNSFRMKNTYKEGESPPKSELQQRESALLGPILPKSSHPSTPAAMSG